MSPAERVDSNPGFTLDIAKILELDRVNARNELSAMLDTKMGGVEKAVSGLQDNVKDLGKEVSGLSIACPLIHKRMEERMNIIEDKISTRPPVPPTPPATKNMKIATIAAIIGSGGIGALVGSGGLVALVKAIFEGIAR